MKPRRPRRAACLGLTLLVLTALGRASPTRLEEDVPREPLRPTLAFSRLPDAAGRYEVEASLESGVPIPRVALHLGAVGPTRLERALDHELDLAPGTPHAFRAAGRFVGSPGALPPALLLEVHYPYPYRQVGRSLATRPWATTDPERYARALEVLERYRHRRVSIRRLLPVLSGDLLATLAPGGVW